MLAGVYRIIEQFFSEKSTNVFPSKYKPGSVSRFLEKGIIHGPITVPVDFRGRLHFDYGKCIGCGMCEKVCPARAIEMYPVIEKEKKTKRIVIFLSRCTFCSECVMVCPKDAITMSGDFMMADYEVYGDSMVVGSEERKKNEIADSGDDAPEASQD